MPTTTPNPIDSPDPAVAVPALRRKIEQWNNAYYAGTPAISDAEFDRFYQQLEAWEREHPALDDPDSPTKKVGAPVSGSFPKVPFAVPMLSIDNCFDLDELERWHHGVQRGLGTPDSEILYAVDYKIDGVSLALTYEDGRLTLATTRGDGREGDLITHNARTLLNVPLRIFAGRLHPTGVMEIRGEAYIANSDFTEVNAAQAAAGLEQFANSRNAAAGAIRQTDPAECSRRRLRFFAHGYGYIELTNPMVKHSDFMSLCENYGLRTIPHSGRELVWSKVKDHIEHMVEMLPTLDFPIDGIVVKVEQRQLRNQLGVGSKYVHWARAYKWERYEAITTVRDITIQVGKQGTLTPVAELEPVEIAETRVSRATLFNRDEIQRLDVRIGDRVVVEKAGKIIPHIMRVEPREEVMPEYQFPDRCPECGGDLEQDGAYTVCTNGVGCPPQLVTALVAMADRKRLYIEGLGPVMAKKLVEKGRVSELQDIYELTYSNLCEIEGIGDGKANKLLAGVEASKEKESWRQLAAWNIKHCGTTASQLLLTHFGHIGRVVEATEEQLAEVPGIGEKTAGSLFRFFRSNHGQTLLAAVRSAGVNLGDRDPQPETPAEGSRALEGLKIVPTGELQNWDRDGIKAAIRRHGGIPSSSVSGKTNLILAGSAPGAKKLEKASELGIEVIDEARFMEMIGQTPTEPAEANEEVPF